MKKLLIVLAVLNLHSAAFAQKSQDSDKKAESSKNPSKRVEQTSAWTCSADCPEGSISLPGFKAPGRVKNTTTPVSGKTIPVKNIACSRTGESAPAAAAKLKSYLESDESGASCKQCKLLSGECRGPSGQSVKVSDVLTVDGATSDGAAAERAH